jgi:hypothetical protein
VWESKTFDDPLIVVVLTEDPNRTCRDGIIAVNAMPSQFQSLKCFLDGSPPTIRTKVYATTLSPMSYEPWFESWPGASRSGSEHLSAEKVPPGKGYPDLPAVTHCTRGLCAIGIDVERLAVPGYPLGLDLKPL